MPNTDPQNASDSESPSSTSTWGTLSTPSPAPVTPAPAPPSPSSPLYLPFEAKPPKGRGWKPDTPPRRTVEEIMKNIPVVSDEKLEPVYAPDDWPRPEGASLTPVADELGLDRKIVNESPFMSEEEWKAKQSKVVGGQDAKGKGKLEG